MNTTTQLKCHYCGDPCTTELVLIKGLNYCCYGCATLDDVVAKINTSEEDVDLRYKQFDLAGNFASLVDFQNDKIYRFSVNLPAIHCSSCIELLEDLPAFNQDVLRAQVNFEQKRCTLTVKKEGKLSTLAQLLDDLGYPPQISLASKGKHQEKKSRNELLFKLAVAGFCFGNIMLYSMPHYFGLNVADDPFFAGLFKSLSLAMSLPVVFYSGRSYLVSAYRALTASRTHINIPIAIGILSLMVWSYYEILSGTGAGYLDSLAGLIFFLLIGKWFQSLIYDEVSFKRELADFIPMVVRKHNTKNAVVWQPVAQLEKGDRILVKSGELIPVDGRLVSEYASIDYSFITGEELPEEVLKGHKIYSGGKQLGAEIIIELEEKPDTSSIWNNWNQSKPKPRQQNWTHSVSRVFTIAVLSISLITGVVWYYIDPSRIAFVCSAVLIVACPCALALSAPFAYGNILRIFSRNKFFIKQADSIQNLANTELIIFDKTGTLSSSSQAELEYNGEELSKEQKVLLYNAVLQSAHPLSQAIAEKLNQGNVELDSYSEHLGKGIKARLGELNMSLGSSSWLKLGQREKANVYLTFDGVFKGSFRYLPRYRKNIGDTLRRLGQHYKQLLMSGDTVESKPHLMQVYPGFSQMHFEQKPEDKSEKVRQIAKSQTALMLGDGLNDAAALQESDFGIAVTESLNGFYPGADGVLLAEGITSLDKFMELARYSKTVLRLALVFSLCYNIAGLAFAVSGQLTPVIAAILMPLSSISAVGLNTLFIRFKAKKLALI